MKQIKISFVLLTLLMIVTLGFTVCAFDGDDTALDVMFVVDGSGSMPQNDPSYLVREACKLFVDICGSQVSRAGFVVFDGFVSQSHPLTDLSVEEERNALMQAFDSIEYSKNGNTDLSLGLKAAVDEFVVKGSIEDGRTPVIILIGDGEIDVQRPERINVNEKELESTIKFCKDIGISIYTIGLINDYLDDEYKNKFVKQLQNLSDETDGEFFEADQPEELGGIVQQIVAEIFRAPLMLLDPFKVVPGEVKEVIIPIHQDGVKQANIIIQSNFLGSITGLRLFAPGGNEVVMPSDAVAFRDSVLYTVISIDNPEIGDWMLSLKGARSDTININLINSLETLFKINASQIVIPNGEDIDFEIYCEGPFVDSAEIFAESVGTITVTHLPSGTSKDYDLTFDGDSLKRSVHFSRAGEYKISGRVVGRDGSFDKPIEELHINVNPYPIESIPDLEQPKLTLIAPIFGLQIMNSGEVDLTEYFLLDPDAVLSAEIISGGWEERVTASFDPDTSTVKVSALDGGTAVINLAVKDSFDQSSSFAIEVSIIPWYIPVAAIAIVIVVVVFVFVAVRLIRKK